MGCYGSGDGFLRFLRGNNRSYTGTETFEARIEPPVHAYLKGMFLAGGGERLGAVEVFVVRF